MTASVSVVEANGGVRGDPLLAAASAAAPPPTQASGGLIYVPPVVVAGLIAPGIVAASGMDDKAWEAEFGAVSDHIAAHVFNTSADVVKAITSDPPTDPGAGAVAIVRYLPTDNAQLNALRAALPSGGHLIILHEHHPVATTTLRRSLAEI